MKIQFKKIPKLAQGFYLIGFILIVASMANYFLQLALLNPLITQQLFIAGAIVVALGSVINMLYQFFNWEI